MTSDDDPGCVGLHLHTGVRGCRLRNRRGRRCSENIALDRPLTLFRLIFGSRKRDPRVVRLAFLQTGRADHRVVLLETGARRISFLTCVTVRAFEFKNQAARHQVPLKRWAAIFGLALCPVVNRVAGRRPVPQKIVHAKNVW